VAWSQRLGSLLDQVGQVDRADGLADYVRRTARETVLLDPRRRGKGKRDSRWKLFVNAHPASDL
jgi:predicted transcriptional regulator of viral defense system